jgi:hypothetical protein
MSTARDLASLLKQVPRDEHGGFKEGPEKITFIDALAAAKPLNPPQLLELAASLRSDSKRIQQADTLAYEALSAIAHDRNCRSIVSRIGQDVTPWGVTVNQLRARIIRAYRAPGQSTRWREIPGASEKVNVPEGDTLYFATMQDEISNHKAQLWPNI